MSYEEDQQAYNDVSEDDTRECEAMRKMFVGGLARSTSEDSFFNYFGQFGEMVDKVIITDPHTKESRGFGFITYSKSEAVEQVFSSRPHVIDNKTLDVKRAMPREFNTAGAHSKTNKLFIGGFKGLDFKPEELQQYIESRHLASYGHIESIDFLKDKETGENKGFGFLICSSTDFADRLAISEMSFLLKNRNMSIKKAEPKEGAAGAMGGRGGRGGMRGGRGAPRGGSFAGRGGGYNGRGGSRGGGRGGYSGGQSNYGGNSYGGGNDYSSTSYPSYGSNDAGYGQQNQQSYGGYPQQQNSYAAQSQTYGTGGYGQQASYGAAPAATGGYGDQTAGYNNTYSAPSSYNGGGRGASRGGAPQQRYQPY